MFDIAILDKPDVRKLLEGSNVLTGFNVRLDIFTAFPPRELSAIIDNEYREAEKKADEAAQDPKKIEEYARRREFLSHYTAPPLPPKGDFLQGPEGPPLGKGVCQGGEVWVHPILQTIGVRDYSQPDGDWAYSMARENLSLDEGNFWLFPTSFPQNVIDDSVHSRFNFRAQTDMSLPQFVLGMMDLYGNYSEAALKAKMMYVAPTKEEGMAQRDALKKLFISFHKLSIPFYVTLHNTSNHHSELVYGINSDGTIVRQLASASQTP